MTLRHTSAWSAALLTVVVGAGVAVAAPSQATTDGPFGQHVRACAQATGFDGTSRPGMHRGASPWHSRQHADHIDHHADHQC